MDLPFTLPPALETYGGAMPRDEFFPSQVVAVAIPPSQPPLLDEALLLVFQPELVVVIQHD